jgi:membrane protease YdiL (CAAX protease family)
VTTRTLDRPTTTRAGVPVFLLLAFGIAWTGMIGAPLLGLSIVNPLVQLPFAFAPAIAALVVRRWVTGEGFRDAGLSLQLCRSWRSYLVAWWGPLGLVAATVGLAAALGWWEPTTAPLDGVVPGLPGWAFVAVLILVVPVLAPVYWGEEFSWTGYLRMRLFPGRPLAAALATGLIWAVWHYPLAFVGYIDFESVPLGLTIWTGWFLSQQVLLSWLHIRSGSIWPTSLAHAGNNMILALVVGELLGPSELDDTALTLLMAVPTAAAALWVVATGRLYRSR